MTNSVRSNSELGHAIWKKSGLSELVAQMSDEKGNIEYEKILGSFENPSLRRRWIKFSTNFVAEWIAHVSDPSTRQRYLTTIQFVGNSFLKSQGYPRSVMFDANKPAESISRFVYFHRTSLLFVDIFNNMILYSNRLLNVAARKHLNMKIDSSQYVGPAIAYIQELVNLASEKGFIMSRISARELSNKLSDTINNDIMEPILRVSNVSVFDRTYQIIDLLISPLVTLTSLIVHTNGRSNIHNARLRYSVLSTKRTKTTYRCYVLRSRKS